MANSFLCLGWVELGSGGRRGCAGFLLEAGEYVGRGRARALAKTSRFQPLSDARRIGFAIERLIGRLGGCILALPFAPAPQSCLSAHRRAARPPPSLAG